MGYTAYFARGSRTLAIDDSTYKLGQDFIPPGIQAEYNMGTGTSANKTGGAERFGTKYSNREWAFTVQVRGTTETAIVQAVRQLVSIIEGESEETLYFYYKGNTLPEPSWGQFGALKRYTVVSGSCQVQPGYITGEQRSSVTMVLVVLQIKPYAEGKRVRAARAAGGIIDTGRGPASGAKYGGILSLLSAENMVNDPAGYNSWTASGGASITRLYDDKYRFMDMPYAARFKTDGKGTIRTEVLMGPNCFLRVIYKPSDGGTVLRWIPAIGETPSYAATIDRGDGFYEYHVKYASGGLTYNLDFANTAATVSYSENICMVALMNGRALTHGDIPGGFWRDPFGTSSSCLPGTISVPVTTELPASGAIAVTYQIQNPESYGAGGDQYTDAGTLVYGNNGFFVAADHGNEQIVLRHSTTAGTFTIGTVRYGYQPRVIVTYNPGTAIVYYNGTALGTSTGSMGTAFSSVQIGSMTSLFRGVTFYASQLTAAQVATLDAELANALELPPPVEKIPISWKPGTANNVMDNAGASGTAYANPYYNYGFLHGIPGDQPARAELSISQGVAVDRFISMYSSPSYYDPGYFVDDRIGAAVGSALGGSVENINIATTDTLIGSCNIPNQGAIRDIVMGRDWYALARIAGTAAGTLNTYVKINIGGQSYSGGTTTIAHGTAYASWRVSPANVPRMSYAYDNPFGPQFSADLLLYAKRPDAAGTLKVDYVQFYPSPVTYVAGTTGDTTLILRDNEAMTGTAGFGAMHYASTFDGRRTLEVKPEEYNFFVMHNGASGSADDITTAGTLDWYITPRWGLL